MSIDFSCNYDEDPDRMLSAVDMGAVTLVIVPSSERINTLKNKNQKKQQKSENLNKLS